MAAGTWELGRPHAFRRLLVALVANHLVYAVSAFCGRQIGRPALNHPRMIARGPSSLQRFRLRRILSVPPDSTLRMSSMTSDEGGCDDTFSSAVEYVGPLGQADAMEAGCVVGNLGLEILIGPSRVAPGRGLFIRVAAEEGVDRVVLKQGTLISGYSKIGTWAQDWQGDKAVAFAFDSPDTAVVYDKVGARWTPCAHPHSQMRWLVCMYRGGCTDAARPFPPGAHARD